MSGPRTEVQAVVEQAPAPDDGPEPARSRRSPWRFLRSPLFLLGLLLVASTASRAAWISSPASVAGDERYYVSAARHMVDLPPVDDEYYKDASSGTDPNSEHPPLGKLFIGLSMKVFGDKPLGWRFPTVAFGTLAVAAMYWLARSAGARPWESLLAATLMAAENLFMVYGRLATLDVVPVFFMILALGLYLRDRPFLAGAALAAGACTKLVALSAMVVIGVIEVLRWAQHRRARRDHRFAPPAGPPSPWRLGACVLATAVVYLAVLGALDHKYSDAPDPITHSRRMVDYAEVTTFQSEAQIRGNFSQGTLAPASKPWQWLLNRGSYSASRELAAPPGQPGSERELLDLQVRLSPFVLLLLGPALLAGAYRAWADSDGPSTVAVAWVTATFGLLVLVALRERVGYLYYMVSVLPGAHLAIARLLGHRRVPWAATALYALVVIGSVVSMFPFRTWGAN